MQQPNISFELFSSMDISTNSVPTPCQIDVKSCTKENLDLKLLIKHQTKVATMLNEQMVKFLSLMKELNL
jgi:hypothetical protein